MNYEYTVIRKPYKRSATIKITEDNHIRVSVPSLFSDKRVKEFIREHSGWIEKIIQKNRKQQALVKPRTYKDGESFLYLGQLSRLRIQYEKVGAVEFQDGELIVPVSFSALDLHPVKFISSRLNLWGKREAERIISERVLFYETVMGVTASRISIKQQKTLWGSCNSRGNLSFNWRLVMAPISVIDYVVVHELSHILHRNHSSRFWKTVESVIPDYKHRKKWLNEHARKLFW